MKFIWTYTYNVDFILVYKELTCDLLQWLAGSTSVNHSAFRPAFGFNLIHLMVCETLYIKTYDVVNNK